jgi:hypothetical protein
MPILDRLVDTCLVKLDIKHPAMRQGNSRWKRCDEVTNSRNRTPQKVAQSRLLTWVEQQRSVGNGVRVWGMIEHVSAFGLEGEGRRMNGDGGMTMLLFTGAGFKLKDGVRSCQKFKVYARNVEEAAFVLNTAAGWMLVKDSDAERAKVLGSGVPVETEMKQAEVHLKWPGQRGFEMVENLKRSRGALRMTPNEPIDSAQRVSKSLEKLVDEGGHRSTVRFSEAAWKGLQALASLGGRNHSDTLEQLILAEVKRKRVDVGALIKMKQRKKVRSA